MQGKAQLGKGESDSGSAISIPSGLMAEALSQLLPALATGSQGETSVSREGDARGSPIHGDPQQYAGN